MTQTANGIDIDRWRQEMDRLASPCGDPGLTTAELCVALGVSNKDKMRAIIKAGLASGTIVRGVAPRTTILGIAHPEAVFRPASPSPVRKARR